jgi:dTDP-4-amino-4,6-dideoxygalactose transaminase
MENQKPIFVTRPFLPPFEEFSESLKKIWDNKWLTNDGEFHQRFEKEVAEFLGVKYVSLFTNGTLALITALQTLRITGEVITTPFSFVATTHALWWNTIKPVFVDIEPDYCNIDADKIEAAITPQTTAILPVHVYGNPCQMDKIQKIADIYGIKVIYDAAHAFGVTLNNTSVLNFGDLSILSFHATKVFNTFEGGAIVCHDEKTKQRIDFLKNFGFSDEVTVVAPGINAKMNEFQAALGLHQLKYFHEVVRVRKTIALLYREQLKNIDGVRFLSENPEVYTNYSYFPIFIDKKHYGSSRDEVYSLLKKNNIYTRRYFYPLISKFPIYRGLPSSSVENLPTAERIGNEVLCLPIYPDLSHDDVSRICKIIRDLH